MTAAALTAWFTARGPGNWRYDAVLLDGAKRCPHDPMSPWLPLYDGDSGDATPVPGGYNFSINLETFQTTAAAVNSAGDWYGTGLSDEAWPTSTTLTAYISSGTDIQALLNLPEGSRVYMEQTPRRYAVGNIGKVTRAGANVTIPITFTERYNFALFKAGHDARLDFTLADPNLRNPTDAFTLSRYDSTLNANGEWKMTLKAGSSGATTWDQLAKLEMYLDTSPGSTDAKTELGRLGASGEAVYITLRDLEKSTAHWADLLVSKITVAVNSVTIDVAAIVNAVGELPPMKTGPYELQVAYVRFDYSGMPGFTTSAALKTWRANEGALDINRSWTMLELLDNGTATATWEKTRWPKKARFVIRISGIEGSLDAALVRNLLRLRTGNVIGIRNNAESFAEYQITATNEQMDDDYRYDMELVEGQLRGGPNFSLTSNPTMWFNLNDAIPPLWMPIIVYKYHSSSRPPIPGRIGVKFGVDAAILVTRPHGPTAFRENMEPGWALSPGRTTNRDGALDRRTNSAYTTLWGCHIAVSNAKGGTIILSEDWLTQPFSIKTPDLNPTDVGAFRDTKMLFSAYLAKTGRPLASPQPFRDTVDIPDGYSRILHKLQYDNPGHQLYAYTGVKSTTIQGGFPLANRTFVSARAITFPPGGRDFVFYITGAGATPPTPSQVLGGYRFTSARQTVTNQRGGGTYIFNNAEYMYIVAPVWVGPMISFRHNDGPNSIDHSSLPFIWVLSDTESPLRRTGSATTKRAVKLVSTRGGDIYDYPATGQRADLIWLNGEPHHIFRNFNPFVGVQAGSATYEVHFKYEDG